MPPGKIRSRCPAKGDMVMELACCSGEVYEPAEEDTTLQANASLPMSDSSSLLVQVRLPRMWCIACSSSVFLSLVMDAVMVVESSSTPRKVMVVDGPSSFSGFVGEPNRWQRKFIVCMCRAHSSVSGGPAVKKSSR